MFQCHNMNRKITVQKRRDKFSCDSPVKGDKASTETDNIHQWHHRLIPWHTHPWGCMTGLAWCLQGMQWRSMNTVLGSGELKLIPGEWQDTQLWSYLFLIPSRNVCCSRQVPKTLRTVLLTGFPDAPGLWEVVCACACVCLRRAINPMY